jgi:hypothetical protein
LSFTFNSKNNNILQLGTVLNNEASVFEGFFQIFSIAGKYFLELSKIPQIINLCQIRLGTKAIYNGLCGYTQPNAHITTLKFIKGCKYFLNDYPLNVPKTEFDLSPLYPEPI